LNSQSSPLQLQLFGGDEADSTAQRRKLQWGLGAAILISAAIIYLATRNLMLMGCFAAAQISMWAIVEYFRRSAPADTTAQILPPDWSILRMTADLANAAVAVNDRAGRLVCANANYTSWFQGTRAPSDVSIDEAGKEILVRLTRTAWRDGEANFEALREGDAEYRVKALRTGAGDEYLLWWFVPIQRRDIETRAAELITGRIGYAMAKAGLMAVTISAEGRLRTANAAFAMRATGSDNGNIIGSEFSEFMRMDEKGSIFFEKEGRKGLPLRLLHIPLSQDGNSASQDGHKLQHDGRDGASMLLIVDDDNSGIDRASALGHIEQLLSTLPLGLALVDRDGRFLFANESFARVVEMQVDQLPPYPGDLVISEDKAAVSESIRRYAGGGAMSGDIAVRLKDQPEDVIALSMAGVRGLGDAAVLIGLKDNSEETKLKRQVAQATKMQAVGQLAGGVAHDFNNILTAIIGYCDLMMLRHQQGDSDYDDILQIKNNSNRAASLTRQLLAFSRQQTLRPQILQLPDVVAEVSNLLKRLLGEKVRLEVHHQRGTGQVRADPGQLEQVIVNLGVNARDAMEQGGVLQIETRPVTQADVRAMRSDILPIGDYVQLSVIDSGCGISKENLAKIFEPFFTTKEVGKGTGLGLSTVYGIVKQSGGFIFADSAIGKGTRFDIYLPVYAGKAESIDAKPKRPAEKPRDLWGSGRVLIVEDEDMVRAVAERALVRQGYVVETARDGEEGLALFADGKRYDLIVSDVVMPNMDGPAMARELRAKYGDLTILFMSGYAEEQLRQSINLDNVFFLPKPFSVQQIAEAVRDAMAVSGGQDQDK
jgi:two-component system, cell cycle sensor histidine kinase and response regulator CckA